MNCMFQLFQYEEMFSSALAGYSRAAALDPGWEDPCERERQLLDYLHRLTALIDNKVLWDMDMLMPVLSFQLQVNVCMCWKDGWLVGQSGSLILLH